MITTDTTPDAAATSPDTLPGPWVPIAEAAAVLRVHPRTVERRVAAGTLPHRRDHRGRVLVLVEVEEPPQRRQDAAQAVVGAERHLQVVEAPDRTTAILAGLADRTLAAGRVEIAQARRSARWGWGVAGSTAVAAAVLVGVVAVRATGLAGEVAAARAEAAGATALAATLAATLDREVERADRLVEQIAEARRQSPDSATDTRGGADTDTEVAAGTAGHEPDTVPEWWAAMIAPLLSGGR
jgi:hypothetical protein